jgi:hypothetical protein
VVKHFNEAFWIDFVRGALSPSAKLTMQQHIDDGCGKCRETVQMWQGVFSIAQEEAGYTPPGDVVRVVKSQFEGVLPNPKRNPVVRLLFDSQLQPAAAGVRGAVPARQLLYETDELCIDLRLEVRRTEHRVCMVGQILSRAASQLSNQDLPVRLYEQNLPLTESVTNQFGEFQLEFRSNDAISLAIGDAEETRICLPRIDLTV